MRRFSGRYMLVVSLLVTVPSLVAQGTIDPTGRWQGSIEAPDRSVSVAVDVARDANGRLVGFFSEPLQNVNGLPLSAVTEDGRSIELLLKPGGSGGGTFKGTIAADGRSMAGDFITAEGGFSVPFSMTRTGAAVIPAAPKSPRISAYLEGQWTGTLEAGARQLRVVLTMVNHGDDTATGTIVSGDGTGVEIPIAITEKGDAVVVDVPAAGTSWSGTVNPARTELVGAWRERSGSLPLTFTRAR